MTTVSVDQMRDKLLTIEQVQNVLAKTEPLTTDFISSQNKILFKLDPDWNTTLDAALGTEPVAAVMRIDGKDLQLTKDAALQAGAQFGYSAALMKKMPADLTERNLNYWYSGGFGETEYNVLSVAGSVAAFTRPSLVPFSNLELLENTLSGIRTLYGNDVEILADYKHMNTLQQTDIRLIIPQHTRTIGDSGMKDVEDGNDLWSAGLHLSNSMIGKKQTSLDAYLFRWWCTNGMTTEFPGMGTWSRRVDGQQEDVYEWARESVEEVLGGLEDRFDMIQALTQLNVAGNTGDIVREIYEQYKIPVSQRQSITDTLFESESLTMYSILNAITSVANEEGLDPRRADSLMRIGGFIPTTVFDTLKARVWREGHVADPTETNPYEIGVTQ